MEDCISCSVCTGASGRTFEKHFFQSKIIIMYFYLILVHSVRLESFISVHSGRVSVDKSRRIASVGVRGMLQTAVHLIMQDFTIRLKRRGPGEQEGGV